MTHYDVDYSGLDQPEKEAKALADIKEYLGERRFEKLTKIFLRKSPEPMPRDQFALFAGLAGIQGYPVAAWRNYIWKTNHVS